MSLCYELRVLELDSQTQLLERVQLLTQFASNFVVIKGEAGAGKTWLAHRYLEAWSHDKNQSLVTSLPNQEDEVNRGNILRQLFPQQMYSTTDSLNDSIERLLDGEACNIVIVVDNAHHASQALLAELWLLYSAALSTPKQNISVVLFTSSDSVASKLTRLSHGLEIKPVELDVDELSEGEAERFFESLVLRYLDESVEKRIKRAFTNTRPLPGEILALGEHKVEKKVIIRSLVGSPAKIAATVAVIVLLLFLGYRWLLQAPKPSISPAEAVKEQTVIPTLEQPQDEVTAEQAQKANQEMPAELSASDDSEALPPVVTSETASVGVAESGERVVITSDVVDALLDDKTDIAVEKAAEIQQAVDSAKTSSNIQPVAIEPPPEVTLDEEVTEALQTPISFSFARDQLNALPSNSYTLQIAAMTAMEDVQRFLNQHSFDKPVRIYPTLRGEEKWYIVTYDHYATIQQARDAAEKLPAELKSLGPWPKALSQVKREIARWTE
ncbi:SPOR domain-containing protein [Vibrio sp. 10N]|uniref:SPOR domain-containing protein n=1 Tax=Vibrio sp. 10N TaxID=3058938 RepID=UPI002812A9B5|nr:ExeA family protein [Vibrio sp. 10N]